MGQRSHGHGHASVGVDDLSECIARIHETVSSSLKRVGGSNGGGGGGGDTGVAN